MNTKPWYESRTIWTNLAALAALGIQAALGESALDPAIQAALLAICNALLRLRTGKPIETAAP